MKNKTFIICTISLLLAALLFIGTVNVIIDPLFQYHSPWFGLQPDINNERYQNPGVAKNFEYENVIVGNSLSENFTISDIEDVFGGKTIKLTASGSHPLDWSYLLNILLKKENSPKNIIFNIDPYIFDSSPTELKHELPKYLYDSNYLNDVSYLFNFSIIKDFTIPTVKDNLSKNIPDYNTIFMWNKDVGNGKEFVLSHYSRSDVVKTVPDVEAMTQNAMNNIYILIPYIEEMNKTEFVFFCSPFSILFWDESTRNLKVEGYENSYYEVCRLLLDYDNVSIYFWNDKNMLDIICNLDNYTDSAHYSPDVCREIALRIKNNQGLLTKQNYIEEIGNFFDFVRSYDYDSIFE